MAIRKQQLRHRVANIGNANQQAMGAYHPVGTEATPMMMPLAIVQLAASPGAPSAGDYGLAPGGTAGVTYQEATVMWGPYGEPIPATTPGSWGQLRAAGRR